MMQKQEFKGNDNSVLHRICTYSAEEEAFFSNNRRVSKC